MMSHDTVYKNGMLRCTGNKQSIVTALWLQCFFTQTGPTGSRLFKKVNMFDEQTRRNSNNYMKNIHFLEPV